MDAEMHIASILVILVLARGMWVLAYAYSSRRVLEERLRVYGTLPH